MPTSAEPLEVLIANERDERLDVVTKIVEDLGHEVVGRARIDEVGPLRSAAHPRRRARRDRLGQ